MFVFLIAIFFISLVSYLYLIKIYEYWKKKKVRGPEPSFLIGNIAEVARRKKALRELVTDFYVAYPNERFVGIFLGRRPVLITSDPSDIKNVLIKDFSYFRNRNLLINKSPIGENVFHASDDHWRLLRNRLTPIFSTGKIKGMFPLMHQCVSQFHDYLSELIMTDPEKEVRQIAVKFTLQFFSSCILGLNVNTLNDDKNIFGEVAQKTVSPRLLVTISQIVDFMFPGLIRKLNIPQSNNETLNFFKELVKTTIKERSGKERLRKDFMDLLMDLRDQGYISGDGVYENKHFNFDFTEMTMVAQTAIFYVAGFETSSSAISFALYELAINQDIQEKAYQELKLVTEKYDGMLTYEGIQELKYMDMILSETLRKYPIAGILVREAAADYVFPDSELKIDKGVRVLIPIHALQWDPKYFPNPEIFDPERFSPSCKNKIHPYTYMPFGEGPRNCIAARFAKTQTMVGVAGLLQKFRVVPSKTTQAKINFNPTALTLQSVNGVHLKILPR